MYLNAFELENCARDIFMQRFRVSAAWGGRFDQSLVLNRASGGFRLGPGEAQVPSFGPVPPVFGHP